MIRPLLRWASASLVLTIAASCGGGGGGGMDTTPSAANSSIAVAPLFGIAANGVSETTVTVEVQNAAGQALSGKNVVLSATGSGNIFDSVQDMGDGIYVGTLASTVAEAKIVSATISDGGGDLVLDNEFEARFLAIPENTSFVRASGDDSADGKSPTTAWASLDFALSQLSPGDTLEVGAGTYAGPVTVSLVGSEAFPIFLRADTEGLATGDAGPVLIDAGGANAALQFDDAQNVVVQGFTLRGAASSGGPGAGCWVTAGTSSNLSLVNLSIYGNARGIHVDAASNISIEGCSISNQTADGVVLVGTSGVSIEHNLIYNNGNFGLFLAGTETGLSVDLCTFYRNRGNQVHEAAAGSDGMIVRSILTEGSADGIHFANGSALVENFNLSWGHTGDDFDDENGGALDATSVSGDPLFFDPDGNNNLLGGSQGADDLFLCNLGSPAFDAGGISAFERELEFGSFLSGYTSRVDGTLDGEGDDGEAVNLGFHYPAETQPVDPLAVGDARLFFAKTGESRLSARAFVKEDNSWRAATLTPPTNSEIKWVINRVSPIEGENELVAALTDNGTSTDLFVRLWDGVKWNEGVVFNPTVSGIPAGQSGQRGFDIEFENRSGHALLVHANGGPNPLFQVFQNQVWSEPLPVFETAPGTGGILWVEMVPRLETDEIALVCLSDDQSLSAITWNGLSWDSDSATLLDTEITTTTDAKAFDVAYETVSGDLLVAWGFGDTFNERIDFATLGADSRTWVTSTNVSADAVGYTVVLESDPASDQILCGIAEGPSGRDTVGMVWDGEDWGNIQKLDTTSAFPQLDLGLAWVGDTGRGVLLYRDGDDDLDETLDWRLFSPGGWNPPSTQEEVSLSGVGDLSRVFVRRLPDADLVSVVLLDVTGSLFGLTFNGESWSFTNGGESLGSGVLVDSDPSKPFSVDFKAR